ncbi:MAG: hypothetical protein CME82_15115 [Halomonas sp.]|nr:hypothetical protein [Halomonas sp.]
MSDAARACRIIALTLASAPLGVPMPFQAPCQPQTQEDKKIFIQALESPHSSPTYQSSTKLR